MRALVLWADHRSSNLGVRVLAAGAAALVEQVHPGAQIVHLHYGSGTAPTPVGDWRRLVRSRVDPREPLRDWLAGFELVVDTRAGDSFSDMYGLRRLATHSLLARLVASTSTPLVMAPQTIGPFASRRARAVGRRSMKDARLVMSRDSASAAYARSLRRPVDVESTDVVFALPRPAVATSRDVVLNVSGLLWAENPHVDHVAYRRAVTDVARGLVADGRRLSLLAHVLDSPVADNDVPAVKELAELLDDGDVELVVPDDLDDVRAVTASARLVVGSRMHACLNALSTGTPAVPLAYSRKFEPLLKDLGWQHTVDLRTAEDPAAAVLALSRLDLTSEVDHTLARAQELLGRAVVALGEVGGVR